MRVIRIKVNAGNAEPYGLLHNEWSDGVLTASRVMRSEEFQRRASAGAYAIFLATIAREAYVAYLLLRACLDGEE